MARLVVGCFLLGFLYCAYARKCNPDEGVEPTPCDPNVCMPPDCACEGVEPDIPLAERPQIIYLTFDDAFTALAEETYYRGLFDGSLTNPDGCAIRATHFISARSNDYSLVNQYFAMGHEVAAHSITHRSPPDYFKGLNQSEWEAEMGGVRDMLVAYGAIPKEEIRGTRAPFLQGGGDVQMNMMADLGFSYDCSMPTQENGYIYMEYGRWPYTLDYKVIELAQACQVEPCPVCSHPGIWNQPMLDLEDSLIEPTSGHGYPCAMLDSCLGNENADDVYNMLMKNFNKGYNGFTRAPMGYYVHAAWFFGYDYRYEGYKRFLEEITQKEDVWIVPVWAGLQYRMNPVTNAEILNGTLPAFHCDSFPTPGPCRPKSCPYEDVYFPEDGMDHTQEYIKVCGYCPENYPWLHNPMGE